MAWLSAAALTLASPAAAQQARPTEPAGLTAGDRRVATVLSMPRGVSTAEGRVVRQEEIFAGTADERRRQALGRTWIRQLVTLRSRAAAWRRSIAGVEPSHPNAVRARRLGLQGVGHYRSFAAAYLEAVRTSLPARLLRPGSAAQRRAFRRSERLRRQSERHYGRWRRAVGQAQQALYDIGLAKHPPGP